MKLEDLKRIAIEGKLQEKAQDDLGIYPQGSYDGSGNLTPRTEWQNGWNAAVMAQTRNVIAYHDFISTLNPNIKAALEDLLLNDVIELSNNDGKITVWLNVNDIFYTAADAEDIDLADLPKVAEINSKYGFHGIIAWVANKRKLEPLDFKYKKTDNYNRAFEELTKPIAPANRLILEGAGELCSNNTRHGPCKKLKGHSDKCKNNLSVMDKVKRLLG